jgi:hypothetical protein
LRFKGGFAMTREELLSDLAYARTLAEEGRHAPLLGGAYLIFWGVLNALAFTAHWAILDGRVPVDQWGFAYLWAGYGVVAGVGMTLLRLRGRGKPGLTTIGARAERAVWLGVSAAIMAIVLGSIGRLILTQDTTAPNAIFGAAFALYGVALIAVAVLAEQKWMRGFGYMSVCVAAALCLFADDPWAYLIAAGGSLLVLTWPGVVLLKNEPSAIV